MTFAVARSGVLGAAWRGSEVSRAKDATAKKRCFSIKGSSVLAASRVYQPFRSTFLFAAQVPAPRRSARSLPEGRSLALRERERRSLVGRASRPGQMLRLDRSGIEFLCRRDHFLDGRIERGLFSFVESQRVD